ncbi:integrase-like protein [Palleronia aestuarii]|uniref:Integrase-like protein n=1 Tax=Palleronia aestuarii TaxID=568105 RepID=A0A2W7NI51_9RHOB|nr:Mu transposase C-terminal domain-containing protein [Palleronia aestuarii]PZX10952.1 integrase-like protein [Palleronia aestuarii]
MTVRMKFTETDRLVIHGTAYRVADHGETGLTIFQHENPALTEVVSFDDMSDLLRTRSAQLQRGFYDRASRNVSLPEHCIGVNDLPVHVREEVLWRHRWCTALEAVCRADKVSLTRPAIAQVMESLVPRVAEMEAAARRGSKERRSGTKMEQREPPRPSTLLEWYRTYRSHARTIMSLVPEVHRAGNRHRRFTLATEAFVAQAIANYANPLRPTVAQTVAKTLLDLHAENRRRTASGETLLDPMSARTIRRRLSSLDPYSTYAMRYGPAAANRKFNIAENGDPALFPMDVVETDSWMIDLVTLFAQSGIIDGLSPAMRADLERGRRWVTLVIDKATRVVLGFRIAEKPTAQTSVAVIADATRDKSHIAQAMGCENPWPFHGGLNVVSADMGPENNNDTFRAAVAAAGGNVLFAPAGQPQLRGTIERILRTFGQQLMPLLVARTFSNPIDKGDYDAEGWASIGDDELARVLVTFVVDIYHDLPHEGLGGETPANCWKRLSDLYGVTPPPDGHTRRAAFGIHGTRKIVGGNVRAFGIEYTSDEIRHHFLHGHGQTVGIRIDPENIGWITVEIDGCWMAAEAVPAGFDGRSLAEWTDICQRLRFKHRKDAAIHEETIRAAFGKIDDIQRNALTRMGLTPHRMSAETLGRLESELFLGLQITTTEKVGGAGSSDKIGKGPNRGGNGNDGEPSAFGFGTPIRPKGGAPGGAATPPVEFDPEVDPDTPWTLEDD